METKRTSFKRHQIEGSFGSNVWLDDLSDFQKVGTLNSYVASENGRSVSTVCLSPDAMRALAADLTLAAALVEENIERKKNAA